MSEPVRSGAEAELSGPTAFGIDPRAPSRRVWRPPLGPAVLAGATLLLTAAAMLALAAGAGIFAATAGSLADRVTAAALGLAALGLLVPTAFAWRDVRAKRRGTIVLEEDAVTLRLPAGRSAFRRLRKLRARVPYAAIAAIETRLEAHGARTLRVYRLRRKDGAVIVLFEDRALGAPKDGLAPVARELAEAAGLRLVELPPAEGRAGFLGLRSAAPPG